MKPRPYQSEAVTSILKLFETVERICYSLATGGGKTALFSFLTKEFISNSNKRVLIMAHRTELISQTINTLFNIGIRSEAVVANKKHLHHSAQVYVAMVETISNRLNKNPYFLPNIDLIIVDECHLLFFEKIFVHFPGVKILGVTATPSTEILHKFEYIGMEYKQRFGLHKIYQKFIQGYSIQNLINDGNLVPELVFQSREINRDELEFDEKKSEYKATGNHSKKMCVVTNYEKFAKEKKTIIFTASTKDNVSVLQDFKDKGYENVRLFDSVNKEESGNRTSLLKWYETTPDAILINTGVFTTGFDEPTIECVILNMSTASLAKYHQMVGRGGRATNKIFKDKFLLIDLGGNVDTFGKWSDPVDWEALFYYKSKAVPKKESLERITFCEECDMIIPASSLECPFCGHEKEIREIQVSKATVHVSNLIYPSGAKIVKYCELYKKDKLFAVDILIQQCIDMFIYSEIPEAQVEETIKRGTFFETMKRVIGDQMLIIESSNLAGEYKKNVITELITKLYKMYNETRSQNTAGNIHLLP